MTHVTIGVKLEDVQFCEVSQSQKDQCCCLSLLRWDMPGQSARTEDSVAVRVRWEKENQYRMSVEFTPGMRKVWGCTVAQWQHSNGQPLNCTLTRVEMAHECSVLQLRHQVRCMHHILECLSLIPSCSFLLM